MWKFFEVIHVIPKYLWLLWITLSKICGNMIFYTFTKQKSTILWIRLWIVIYIIHIDFFRYCIWSEDSFLHLFNEISTSYPQIVDIFMILWISYLFLWKVCGYIFIAINMDKFTLFFLTSIFLWYIIIMIFSDTWDWYCLCCTQRDRSHCMTVYHEVIWQFVQMSVRGF